MSAARSRVLGLLMIAAVGAAAFALWARQGSAPPLRDRPEGERPALKLLTSLPLMFGDDFCLEGNGSAALSALRGRYRVEPLSTGAEVGRARLLLMAQPRAQRPEDLVGIDRWIRSGGRALLLADPALAWPSGRPLGDPLRPPLMFADTGLLARWGLRLDAPDATGTRLERVGDYDVLATSPGTLVATARACRVEDGGLVARCRIGRGSVTVIADADFLDAGSNGGLDGPTWRNLDALLAELARLER